MSLCGAAVAVCQVAGDRASVCFHVPLGESLVFPSRRRSMPLLLCFFRACKRRFGDVDNKCIAGDASFSLADPRLVIKRPTQVPEVGLTT